MVAGSPMIPVIRPVLGPEEAAAAAEVISSGWLAEGPRVREFESAFAAATGTGHAVAVSSCTAALHLAMIAAGVSSWRRGHRSVDVVHRDRERSALRRCADCVR